MAQEAVAHQCACGHGKAEHYSGIDFCDAPGCACVEFNLRARLVSETRGPTEFRCAECEHVWSEHQKAADQSSTECFWRDEVKGGVCDCDAFVADLKTPPKEITGTGGNPIMFMTPGGEVTISRGDDDDDD